MDGVDSGLDPSPRTARNGVCTMSTSVNREFSTGTSDFPLLIILKAFTPCK
jgi:hypothetical protein